MQAVSGQKFPMGYDFTDQRIKAAVAFSPSTPRRGSADKAFGSVSIPWLLMTGTHDEARIGGQTVESRRQVFPSLPKGHKYELVLDKAEHSAFTDRALPGDALNPITVDPVYDAMEARGILAAARADYAHAFPD